MLTFQAEPWAIYHRDCQDLWAAHYDELALRKERMQMKPDVPAYEAMEAAGMLHILVARDAGEMVGYVITVVRKHLHYADVFCGFEDAYFLRQSHRRGMAGVRLLREWEKAMKARGVQLLFAMTKPWLDMSPLFERLGFTKSDYTFAKWIGDV